MLWAKLDADGTLVIQADEPIEAYALKQWHEQHAAQRATLKIETGSRIDIEQLTRALAREGKEFKAWKRRCEMSTVIPTEDAETLGIRA